jgi:hypothetical protein
VGVAGDGAGVRGGGGRRVDAPVADRVPNGEARHRRERRRAVLPDLHQDGAPGPASGLPPVAAAVRRRLVQRPRRLGAGRSAAAPLRAERLAVYIYISRHCSSESYPSILNKRLKII